MTKKEKAMYLLKHYGYLLALGVCLTIIIVAVVASNSSKNTTKSTSVFITPVIPNFTSLENSFFKNSIIFRRLYMTFLPSSARQRVTSSAYSRLFPIVTPRAITDSFTL